MAAFEGPGTARMLEVVRGLTAPADGTLAACTWVPPAGEGVCGVCHGSAPPGRGRCFTCFRTAGQVSLPAGLVVPISLYRTGDDLWRLLRRYKDGRDAEGRRGMRRRLARLLSQFLRFHLACIAPGASSGWSITGVPPTRRREDARPLDRTIRLAPWLRRRHLRTLRTVRAPEHNEASDSAFEVIGDVSGRELLLVDDTFTTGASVQSAASALQLAGARVLAVVVLGRVVNPRAAPDAAGLWEAARARRFRLDACCIGHGGREGGS